MTQSSTTSHRFFNGSAKRDNNRDVAFWTMLSSINLNRGNYHSLVLIEILETQLAATSLQLRKFHVKKTCNLERANYSDILIIKALIAHY
jgi:hypothetical protein